MTTTFTAKGDISIAHKSKRVKEEKWNSRLERFERAETREIVERYPDIFWRIPLEDPFNGPKAEFLRTLILTPQADSGESMLQDIQFEAGLFLKESYPFTKENFSDDYYLPFNGGRLLVTFKVTYKKYLFITVELNPR